MNMKQAMKSIFIIFIGYRISDEYKHPYAAIFLTTVSGMTAFFGICFYLMIYLIRWSCGSLYW